MELLRGVGGLPQGERFTRVRNLLGLDLKMNGGGSRYDLVDVCGVQQREQSHGLKETMTRITTSSSVRTGIYINAPVRVSYPLNDANTGADLLTNVYTAEQQVSNAWKDLRAEQLTRICLVGRAGAQQSEVLVPVAETACLRSPRGRRFPIQGARVFDGSYHSPQLALEIPVPDRLS